MINFEISWQVYVVVFPTVFLAGLLDAIAGGGGLLSVPAYLAAGLPPQLALGTNKLSSCAGTALATFRYLQYGYIDLRTATIASIFAIFSSYWGAQSVLLINPTVIRYALLVLIPLVSIVTLLDHKRGQIDQSHTKTGAQRLLWIIAAALGIGFYDGIFGPGTGSFLMLFFTTVLRYDLIRANGNTKLVNLCTNLSALITFIWSDQVAFAIGLPAAAASIAGNLVGSQLVVSRGNQLIRYVFLCTLGLLLGKIIWDLVKPA